MNKIKKILMFVCFLTVFTISSVQAKINMFPKPRYIPNLSFYDDNNKAYRLKDFKADMLMVVVWSRYCGPCIKDMKSLKDFEKKVRDKGIRVILISPEKEWKSVADRELFLKQIGAPGLEHYLDKKANFRDGMGILVTPTVLLVNRNNEEAGQITGSVKWDDKDVIKYMIQLKTDMLKNLNYQETADQQNKK